MDSKMKKLSLLLMSVISLSACQASDTNKQMPANDAAAIERQAKVAEKELDTQMMKQWQKGKVVFNEFEGGFFGIVTDSGEKLLPMNLKTEYRQAGAIVKFKGKKNNDVMTIQQWGTPFTIESIELISKGKPPKNSSLY